MALLVNFAATDLSYCVFARLLLAFFFFFLLLWSDELLLLLLLLDLLLLLLLTGADAALASAETPAAGENASGYVKLC